MYLDLHYCARLLQSFDSQQSIRQGKQIHLLFLKKGVLNSAVTIANRLLQMYVRWGRMTDARKLFDEMTQINCFTWNTLIEGYMKSGRKKESLELFYSMPYKNDFSWNIVISGFAKAGELNVARGLFNEMPMKNVIAWNAIIHGYACNGCSIEALTIFKKFKSNLCEVSLGDTFVLATVLGACTNLLALDMGKQIHARILADEVELDSVLGSSLLNMYGKCGDLDCASYVLNSMQDPDDFSLSALISGYANSGRMNDARRVFNMRTDPCIVLWNSLIAGYIANKEAVEALYLFHEMRSSGVCGDSSTFASVLSASGSVSVCENNKQVHTDAYKCGVIHDLVVASALVDAYAKCGSPDDACKLFSELKIYDTVLLNSMINIYFKCGKIEDARQIFKNMTSKSLISWNSMIVGLSQNGLPLEALNLFGKLNKTNLSIDKFSMAGAISACASISLLELGEQVFARVVVIGLDFDPIISTSLIDFYCKCGFVDVGRKLFDQMINHDEVSWNSMLIGYATNGYGIKALKLFYEMKYVGFTPTDITFTGVLSACDHCGLVEEGRKWFYAMKHDYHIDPGIEHYSCMVDLLARAGCLEEAMDLIGQMPFEADASMWSSVLRGCVVHGNKILGKEVVERITELDPKNAGAYVQLSNIFATSGDWESSGLVRKFMKDEGIRKNSGSSWVNGLL